MNGSTFSMGFDAHAGQSPRRSWWTAVVVCFLLMLAIPVYGDMALQLDLSLVLILSLLALSMAFLWGYVGILSFGQTIFFGLGGYTYALFSLNTDMAGAAFVLAVVVPMLFALVLGYFMIFGRISDIYLSVITLVVTLIFEKAVRSTSGPEYVIGSVRLNGQNGIPGLPGLPFQIGPIDLQSIDGIFYLALFFLLVVYVGIRLFLASTAGRVLVGLRENENRMELLGYDSRLYKLLAFVIAGGIAGLAGGLYALWGSFVGPEMFGLNQAAMVVIWVIVGGRSTLLGPIVGTLLIQYLTTWLGTVGVGQVTVFLGFILILCVLLLPQGLVPALHSVIGRVMPQKEQED
ncbi:MAG: branched-chain amino acid ABC transporter permease [Burkholderiaceae bacterium]|nr:branched-chain amino acid ABC transporter permease [Burkholderiaceae bacterium]